MVARFVAKHEAPRKGNAMQSSGDCKQDLMELLARYKCNAVLTHSESLGNAGRRIPSAAALYQASFVFALLLFVLGGVVFESERSFDMF